MKQYILILFVLSSCNEQPEIIQQVGAFETKTPLVDNNLQEQNSQNKEAVETDDDGKNKSPNEDTKPDEQVELEQGDKDNAEVNNKDSETTTDEICRNTTSVFKAYNSGKENYVEAMCTGKIYKITISSLRFDFASSTSSWYNNLILNEVGRSLVTNKFPFIELRIAKSNELHPTIFDLSEKNGAPVEMTVKLDSFNGQASFIAVDTPSE